MSLFLSLMQFLIFFICVLLSVALFSLLERKILGIIHYRKGPNKVAVKGLTQPFSDAMKLISKDDYSLAWSNKITYYVSPMIMFILPSLCWMVLPTFLSPLFSVFSFIIIYFLLGLTVYSIMLSGWSSNSKYSMIGAMRAISQTISYEVIFSFMIISMVVYFSSFSVSKVFSVKFIPILALAPMSLIFIFTILAELNRTPFDLAEGESELVSGYTIEYGGVMYTIIFLSENMFILFACYMFMLVFFSFSSVALTSLGLLIMLYTICVIRGILPRMRYDKLMSLCWTKLLPSSMIILNLLFIAQYL